MNTEKIYFVLTKTDTFISKLIRLYTGEEYNHLSISFDRELTEMYSMSRTNYYNCFSGKLKLEDPFYTYLKYFSEAKCLILELDIPADKKETMRSSMQHYLDLEPRYNMVGLFLNPLSIEVNRENHFFCSEFIDKFLIDHGLSFFDKPSCFVQPKDFKNIPNLEVFYEGNLVDYGFLKEEVRFLYDTRICNRHESTKYRLLQGFVRLYGR